VLLRKQQKFSAFHSQLEIRKFTLFKRLTKKSHKSEILILIKV